MEKNNKFVKILYGTSIGCALWKMILKIRIDKMIVIFLNSPVSKALIPLYIRRHHINMKEFSGQKYGSFQEFFARKCKKNKIDYKEEHLISPCDGWLSAFPIQKDSSFKIKGFHYKLSDLTGEKRIERNFTGGTCLIFRLSASDYHHYCYIDNGYQGKNYYIPGELHSVQPMACEKYPVYKLNRRVRTILETENFGNVLQIEVGAFVVGGIKNEKEYAFFKKGMEKGHFELAGSTIVLFFKKDKIKLLPKIQKAVLEGKEVRVRLGMCIGEKCQ